MIILDTNVVSEFMTSPPSAAVLNWMNTQDPASLYITAISIAEISFGLHAMPPGQRRRLLEDRFERFIETAFPSRVLRFDEAAARVFGEIKAHRRTIGRPVSDFDGQIASITRVHGYGLATRNLADFEHCLLDLIDPFAFDGEPTVSGDA